MTDREPGMDELFAEEQDADRPDADLAALNEEAYGMAEVPPDEYARSGDLCLVPWPPSGGVLLRRDGDDLNEPQALHLSPAELRWLALYGATQAYRLLPPAVRADVERWTEAERVRRGLT